MSKDYFWETKCRWKICFYKFNVDINRSIINIKLLKWISSKRIYWINIYATIDVGIRFYIKNINNFEFEYLYKPNDNITLCFYYRFNREKLISILVLMTISRNIKRINIYQIWVNRSGVEITACLLLYTFREGRKEIIKENYENLIGGY